MSQIQAHSSHRRSVGSSQNDPEGEARVAAFQKALQRLGWTEGRNVMIECAFVIHVTASIW
jgi:hypothetical protein